MEYRDRPVPRKLPGGQRAGKATRLATVSRTQVHCQTQKQQRAHGARCCFWCGQRGSHRHHSCCMVKDNPGKVLRQVSWGQPDHLAMRAAFTGPG